MLTSLIIAALTIAPVTIPIWNGTAPGSQNWTQRETIVRNTPLGTVAINVVKPTLTVYLPDPKKATGTGVIVAPGGACIALTLTLEGESVARWLQQRGIAAFVLAYRTMEKRGSGIPPDLNEDVACRWGMADGVQAVSVVREHAAAWHVSPHKIGVLGFSAGGMVASAAVLQKDAAARPDFAGFIYGGPLVTMPPIPQNLPPIFMAWAQDDPQVLNQVNAFYAALRAAGAKPEAHIYSAGGHGFGMKHQGTTSDRWSEDFYAWMQAQGFAPGKP
ncbi:MAG TPA: alpha/beta hydrolase [Candidatus Baltobacteraceae bacterium]|nr:alpha/beta hydrolase [Candidatus Baltobacteraceae bacterium]